MCVVFAILLVAVVGVKTKKMHISLHNNVMARSIHFNRCKQETGSYREAASSHQR
jgi:hypothetical protein